jgi:hypothetical protein
MLMEAVVMVVRPELQGVQALLLPAAALYVPIGHSCRAALET